MNIETREQILQSCEDWLKDAKLKKKGMFIEMPNPIQFLQTKYVKVEDVIKMLENLRTHTSWRIHNEIENEIKELK